MSRIITLTTDFGLRDAYVAAMKGVILGIAPDVRLVDISHGVSPQDVMEAAFVLRDAASYFPAATIHLAVVDPGVGTSRRPVAIEAGGHYFVGPDNGLFPLLLDGREPARKIELNRQQFWRAERTSSTFHGRDIFAPIAAHLASGRDLDDLGTPIERLTPLHWALPISDEQGIQGWIVHIDRFGNCITNITRELLEMHGGDLKVKCFVGNAIVDGIQPTYAAVATGDPLIHFNSRDFLEVAVNQGNAAELLGIRRGDSVKILFRDSK